MLGAWLRRVGWVVVLAVTVAAAAAQAQTPTNADRDRQARAEFSAGRDAFAHGDFVQAAQRFEEAYRLSQRAQLLYNLGTTYDRLHRWTDARDAFRHYLDAFPSALEADEIRGRLAVIDQEIARDTERDRILREHSAAPRVVVVPGAVIVRTVPSDPRLLRTVGIVTAGLGVVGGIVSAVVGALTNDQYNRLVASCGQQPGGCPQPSIDDISLRQTLTNVFAIAGTAVFVAGAVMFVIDAVQPHRSPATADRARVGPNVGVAADLASGRAGFVLVGTF